MSWAYPEFISYGYASCLTCHYNSQGNGALNDYGRALFAAEISSRALYDDSITDEQLGESSGFLGKKPLPWWFRPGIKYRGLWFQNNPGSVSSVNKYITMQASFNAAFLLDQNQKSILVAEYSYVPTPQGQQNSSSKPPNWASREHYLRYQLNDEMFLFAGLMDKVYGIRTVDHTAYSRAKTGNAQNDQTHGFVFQYNKAPYEYTGHIFVGNLAQEASTRQKGFSAMVEKDMSQFFRVGSSVMVSQSDFVSWTRLAGHSKLGFGKRNSLLSEVGLIQNKPKSSAAETGGYALLQNLASMTRGYNFLSQVEYYNQTLSTKSPDLYKWSLGFLAFPAPKYEVRATMVNGRTIDDSGTSDDQWSLQWQIHASL
jgi:hypothetical protein